MKTKKWHSALLAFALLSTGCSNEIDPDNNGGGSGSGDIVAKMNVYIQTEGESSTKASADDEEGDGNEAGSIEESNVKNISVFLYKKNTTSESEDELIALNSLKSRSIVAKGYVENTSTSASGSGNHTWQATVDIQLTSPSETLTGNTYGVIAVVNAGNITTETYSTVGALANKVLEYQTAHGFVMSTHVLSGSPKSVVTFADASSSTIPSTTVYVERLAAKVRMNSTSNYTYNPVSAVNDKVTLNSAIVFNRLSSGSYLLKRVSNAYEKELSAVVADDQLLGDEVYNNLPGSLADNTANFVITPWTRDLSASTPSAVSYKYPLCSTTTDWNIGKFKESINHSDIISLDASKSTQDLAYTNENTLNVADSKYGHTTGVLFEATYIPEQVYKIADDKQKVSLQNFVGGTDNNFYVYNKLKFISLDAIFAYTLLHQSTAISSDYFYYSDFLDTSTKTVADYKASKTYKSSTIDDVFGFMKKLDEAVDLETNDSKLIKNVFPDFVTYISLGGAGYADRFKNVAPYEGCKCYYLYWIRHEDNGLNTIPGPMEFSIVRNNIYDLTVTGISGLGLPVTENPKADTPDESIISQIEVTVKVKNWVVRKNNNIIL